MVLQESVTLIRNYILNRDGRATKGEVTKYMQNVTPEHLRLSRDTTLKVIENMDSIIILKGSRRGQGHKLLIEDRREFDVINQELSEIETIVETMTEPMEKFRKIGGFDPKGLGIANRWILKELENKFSDPYFNSIEDMLEILLTRISKRIVSRKDAWSLYSRIIEIKISLNEQNSVFQGEGAESLFMNYNALIQFCSSDLNDIDTEKMKFAENHGIPINSITRQLISKIQNFKTRFLPEPDYPKLTKTLI